MTLSAPPHTPPEKPPITGTVIILTYGRSGSTLIQHLLNTIPGYSIRGENDGVIASLAEAWATLVNSKNIKPRIRNQIVTTSDHPWFGAERIDPEAYGRGLAHSFIDAVLQPPAGTTVTGFKEIRWNPANGNFWRSARFLRDCFPNPRFIINTRDHNDVARSGWWKDRPRDAVLAQLGAMDTAFSEFAAANPQICHQIRYGDYTADHGTLRGLYDFLGAPWDAAQVQRLMAKRLTHLQTATDQPEAGA